MTESQSARLRVAPEAPSVEPAASAVVHADPAIAAAYARVLAFVARLERDGQCSPRLIETHISWVVLGDTEAWKFKKPVRLPFLDFSSLAARRHYCEEELRLNRRLAPSLYLDVVECRDLPTESGLTEAGPVVEVAVHMKRFPDDSLWSDRLAAGALQPEDVDALAALIARFHQACPIAPASSDFATAPAIACTMNRLKDGIDMWLSAPLQGADSKRVWTELSLWLQQTQGALASFFEQRRIAGRVREGHGDLHLRNVLQLDGEPVPFDGIEFDPGLRWIDVAHDAAFLAMDLASAGRQDLAWRFVNAWLEATGDYECLPGLRFFLVSRALVRCHVAAIAQAQGNPAAPGHTARDYLHLAAFLAASTAPTIALMHGLPGSGKSFVAARMLEAGGAIRVRSDVERKRLFGLGALDSSAGRLSRSIYDSETTQATYARLEAVAVLAMRGGWPLLIDAAFLRFSERESFARLAAAAGARFAIFDCQAPDDVLRRRIVARLSEGKDASEADLAVADKLRNSAEPVRVDESRAVITVDTNAELDVSGLLGCWLGPAGHDSLASKRRP